VLSVYYFQNILKHPKTGKQLPVLYIFKIFLVCFLASRKFLLSILKF